MASRSLLVFGVSLAFADGTADSQTLAGYSTSHFGFLSIPEVGARAMGMGGAFVALADDGSAASWNPAGLSRLDLAQVHATADEKLRLELSDPIDPARIPGQLRETLGAEVDAPSDRLIASRALRFQAPPPALPCRIEAEPATDSGPASNRSEARSIPERRPAGPSPDRARLR